MIYTKINGGDTYSVYDEVKDTGTFVKISEIEEQISSLEIEIAKNDLITDEQLLVWAKKNYPNSQRYKEQQSNITEKERLEELLTHLK